MENKLPIPTKHAPDATIITGNRTARTALSWTLAAFVVFNVVMFATWVRDGYGSDVYAPAIVAVLFTVVAIRAIRRIPCVA